MEQLTLQEQTVQFFSAWRSIEKLYNQYAKSLGMTYMSLVVLEVIYNTPENESCTQKTICEQTHLPKQSVNGFIKTFWEQGYVEMTEHPNDRRNKEIKLSESGKIFAENIIGKILKAEQEAFGRMNYNQRQEIIELFQNAELSLKEIIKTDSNEQAERSANNE
ncbi:MarR family winged helix-turn-helix transcriptional regulator [Tyzzerella sp. OttesenSCG-928-J15]|nr:MarR family winged helix-turn-helix transcriptional regulator [Tyzzerella sp. OttesenSCG-928-J15]